VGNRLSPKELALYEMHLNQLNKSKKGQMIALNKGEIIDDDAYLSKEILNQPEIKDENCAFDCFVGKCAFWVTWDGRLTPCGMLNEPEAFPLSEGFKNAWEKMNSAVNKIPVCTDCRDCDAREYCNPCPARRFSETGSYDKKAPYLCECTRERMELVLAKKYL
jgi:radical SAM protein with 4Fe4S-binding SPASM domain